MRKISLYSLLFGIGLLSILFQSCKSGGSESAGPTTYKDQVVVHNLSDPEKLHPTNANDANASEIGRYMFQMLLDIDMESSQLVPVLAKEMPTMTLTPDGNGMVINYELKEDAVWDDGKPITARDVEFSYMCIKNPKVDCPAKKPYLDFIVDFKYDETNPKKFSLICDKKYMLWDHSSGNIAWIIPEHLYDPKGIMKGLKLSDFSNPQAIAKSAKTAEEFATEFNSPKYDREANFIFGSGGYKFKSWETNQRIVLERKDNWWASKHKTEGMYFEQGPKEIVYETVNDQTTAVTALKSEKLDAMQSIRPSDWVELDKSEKFVSKFNKLTHPDLAYTYLGLHMKDPKFADKRTRQAIAHLVDADKINQTILYGLQKRTVGPILPLHKREYAYDLKPYAYDPELAKKLLAEAGWKDSNNDGTLDKMIDGKSTPLKIIFSYNQGNDVRKNVGLAFQESARQAGIDVEVSSLEWSVLLERMKEHKLDMWYGGWATPTTPSDPIQLWGTEAYSNGGSNYSGWGDATSDKLIADIRTELDVDKRAELYKQFQRKIYDEVPCVFLFTFDQRNAVHKRFTNIKSGSEKPGFYPAAFQPANMPVPTPAN